MTYSVGALGSEAFGSAGYVPSAPPAVVGYATSFSTTILGTPSTPHKAYPSGFTATQFSVPYGTFDQFGIPAGFKATNFGTVTGAQFYVARNLTAYLYTPSRITQFGMPARKIPFTAHGFLATKIGTASAITTHQTGWAAGQKFTAFGTPAALSLQRYAASGFSTTYFGTPAGAKHFYGAGQGFVATHFGQPRTPKDVVLPQDMIYVRSRQTQFVAYTRTY